MGVKRSQDANCAEIRCPIEEALGSIGGMWKVIIIRELLSGVKRYSQLHRALAGVTHKMLTQQLRELEADGVVKRTVYPVVPPKVEYELTPLGLKLRPILEAMNEWGTEIANKRRAATAS
jgi:DNA-binding HxlR family transcriptional regulator